jgi:hypothetical protein
MPVRNSNDFVRDLNSFLQISKINSIQRRPRIASSPDKLLTE